MTLETLEKNYKFHHHALDRGYVSRKHDPKILPYNGRFGKGYKVIAPNYKSTRYCWVLYYIKM